MACPQMRPFGRVQDLDIDFADQDRPALVTALLARNSEPSDAEFWRAQPVGGRIAALLRVLAFTEGDRPQLPVRLSCTEPQCGEPLEIALPFDALLAAAPGEDDDTARPVPVSLPGGRSAALRRPTGRDLHAWRRTPCASRHEAVATMLDALVVEGVVMPEDEPAIADVMATHDPLVAFTVSCACPACGAERDRPIDLETICLARLRQLQRGLLREIHVLASTYGWTEKEVLAIPPARRAHFLRLIEDGP
jgi:hypothetical protein